MEKELLGLKIFKGKLNQINFNSNKVINTINPHSYCEALTDNEFREALKQSDILLPDGIGIVWAEKFLNKNSIKRIAGYDLFIFLMKKLESEKGSVFFLGSSLETLTKIKTKVKQDFPNIKVGYYSPPFKSEFSHIDSQQMCNSVNIFKPDVLFVGMTAPKQEKWSYQFKNQLQTRNICSIGAVFDFYAGNVKRAPEFFIRIGMEWIHRSITSNRLLKRNIVSTPKFILHIYALKFNRLLKEHKD